MHYRILLPLILAVLLVSSCSKSEKHADLSIVEINQTTADSADIQMVNDIAVGIAIGRDELKERINQVIREELSEDTVASMITDAVARHAGETPAGTPIKQTDESLYSTTTLRVACSGDCAPMNWTDSVPDDWTLPLANKHGKYVSGVDVEIIKAIANALKVNVAVFRVQQEKLTEALTGGGADIVISSFAATNWRRQFVDFTIPYYRSKMVMVARAGSDEAKYGSIDRFKGKKVVARRGTIFADYVREWSSRYGLRVMTSASSTADMLASVREGNADAALTEYPVALDAVYKKNTGNFFIYYVPDSLLKGDLLNSTYLCLGCTKNNPWKGKANAFFSTLDEATKKRIMKNAEALSRGETVDESEAVVLSDEAKNSSMTLRIGGCFDYAPLNWSSSTPSAWGVPIVGQEDLYACGFEVEILKMLANYLKVNLAIYRIDFDAVLPGLTTNMIDFGITLSPTEERRKSYDFTEPYHKNSIALLTKEGTPLSKRNRLESARDMTCTAKKGTVFEPLLDGFSVDYGIIRKPSLLKDPDLIIAVKSGVTDAAILDSPVAELASYNQSHSAELGFWQKVWFLLSHFKKEILAGVIMTVTLALLSTTIALFIGLLLALGRELRPTDTDGKITTIVKTFVKRFCDAYVTIFRGTPLLVQSMVLFFGIPIWANLPSVYIFGGYFLCALIIMSLNIAAYMCEIVRGGLLALDKGQTEGALALGFTRWQTNRLILLPQAVKNALPVIMNEYIVSLKDSSILNLIGLTELYATITIATDTNYFKIEGYLIVAVIYLLLTLLLSGIITIITKKLLKEKININPFRHQPVAINKEDILYGK